eukprot:gene5877-11871_t
MNEVASIDTEISYNSDQNRLGIDSPPQTADIVSSDCSKPSSEEDSKTSDISLRPEEINNTPTDRYGFFITDKNRAGLSLSQIEIQRLKSKENERTRKWIKMVKNWDTVINMKTKKLKRRIRKGIPDIVRAKVWIYLADIEKYKKLYPCDLMKPIPQNILNETEIDEIERDLDRTFPRHAQFTRRGGEGQKALRRILQNYVIFDKETGYCQGMGFIAAMLLTYMVEEDAFYCLVSAMQRQKAFLSIHVEVPLKDLFKANFVVAQYMISTYWSLLAEIYPKLYTHLITENMHPSMFATEWFLTMFSRSFPFELVTRVWDVFWSEGYKIVYRVALALIKSISKLLKQSDFENIMRLLKELPYNINVTDIMEVPITTERMHALENFHKHVGPS